MVYLTWDSESYQDGLTCAVCYMDVDSEQRARTESPLKDRMLRMTREPIFLFHPELAADGPRIWILQKMVRVFFVFCSHI